MQCAVLPTPKFFFLFPSHYRFPFISRLNNIKHRTKLVRIITYWMKMVLVMICFSMFQFRPFDCITFFQFDLCACFGSHFASDPDGSITLVDVWQNAYKKYTINGCVSVRVCTNGYIELVSKRINNRCLYFRLWEKNIEQNNRDEEINDTTREYLTKNNNN